MALSLAETQAVSEIARVLYDYLPGKAHPLGTQALSFERIAQHLGLAHFWQGGSKLPAITLLLSTTLDKRRDQFCPLMLEIVRNGMIYRNNKGAPITREDISTLNALVSRVQFKIPELWDTKFIDSLPSQKPAARPREDNTQKQKSLEELKSDLLKLGALDPQARGYAFQSFLHKLFQHFELAPRSAFRLTGEEIDGSLQIGTDVYLVEAKWHDKPIGNADLLIFRGKVENKATWSRGLFISHSGFTEEGQVALSRGHSTNMIGMTAQDIFFILEGEISLVEAILQKARRAAETGEFYVSVYELTR